MKPESDNEFYKKEAKDMVNVIQRLLMEGKRAKKLMPVKQMCCELIFFPPRSAGLLNLS